MKPFASLIAVFLLCASPSIAISRETTAMPAQAETEALFAPDRDLAEVKLASDHMVDPSTNIEAAKTLIGHMVEDVRTMAGEGAGSGETLAALKRYLYESGVWNDNRPFQYDLDDPLGEKPANRMLQRYLTTRRGNCVTMPILVLLLGERLGLKMTLAEAPLHLFVKYTDDDGKVWNLEATSGAGFTRDIWYREKLPMTDKAVANGVYLRALSREETVATMAAFLVEHQLAASDYETGALTADVILRHYPNSGYVLAKKGTAYYRLLQREIISKYTRMEDIPPDLRARADLWYRENNAAFDRAEALGWRLQDGQTQ